MSTPIASIDGHQQRVNSSDAIVTKYSPKSGRPVQLTLLDHPFVRFAGAFDAVLAVIAFRRQKLRDLEQPADPAAPIGAGGEVDGLADLEFVFAQRALLGDEKGGRLPPATVPDTFVLLNS
jgi:hypothetical protein